MNRKEYQRLWRQKNKDKAAAYSKKYRDNNPDKRAQAVAKWRAANPDKVKEMSAKAGKKWAASNKDIKNAHTAKRRASIKNKTPEDADLELIKLHYAWAAWLTENSGAAYEVDHVIPLSSEDGLHVETNLQVIPRQWNRSKGARV